MCSSSPPPPDPSIGQAALNNAQLSREAMDYYRQKDAANKPYADAAMGIALDESRTQAATSAKQNAMADETYNYTKNTFRPLEGKIATDALNYDTPARRDAESAQAMADVGSGVDAQRVNAAREVISRGGDVNSGNFTASLARNAVVGGAAQGAAGNLARKNVEAVGGAKLADAAALGRGIAATNATQTQLGLQTGNSAVANAQVPGAIVAQQVGLNNSTTGVAMGGNTSAGNLMLGQYNAVNGGPGDGSMQALGTVAGAGLSAVI